MVRVTTNGLIAVACVSGTSLAAYLFRLAHAKALHLTKSQADKLEIGWAALAKSYENRLDANTKDLEDTKAKLSALSNRVR